MSKYDKKNVTLPTRFLDMRPKDYLAPARTARRLSSQETKLVEAAKSGVGLVGLVQRSGFHPTVVARIVGIEKVMDEPEYEKAVGLYWMLQMIGSERDE